MRWAIDKQCRYFPFKPSDLAPGLDPVCQRRQAELDDRRGRPLATMPTLHAQALVAAP
jgi:hypothetical protein